METESVFQMPHSEDEEKEGVEALSGEMLQGRRRGGRQGARRVFTGNTSSRVAGQDGGRQERNEQ